MPSFMHSFTEDETGAVTVDWVVLTAAVVGLGLAAMTVVRGGLDAQTGAVDAKLRSGSIVRTAFTGAEMAALEDATASLDTACAAAAGKPYVPSCDPAGADLSGLADMTDAELAALEDVTQYSDTGVRRSVDDDGAATYTAPDGTVLRDEYHDLADAGYHYQTSYNAALAAERAARGP